MNRDASWLASTWASHLSSCLETMTGLTVTVNPPGDGSPSEDLLLWETSPSGHSDTRFRIEAGTQHWAALGRLILGGAGITDASEEDWRQTFIELLQQSFGSLGQFLSRESRQEVTFETGRIAPPSPEPRDSMLIQFQAGEEPAVLLRLGFSQDPAALLSAWFEAPGKPASSQTDSLTAQARGGHSGSRTLDLLLEVELPVAVSFGRTQMRLKEAAKLTTGSIVELNRSVSEPVEVIVNNCVIARGEVVVVEGNYGVRIQEIVSREERLRTLF